MGGGDHGEGLSGTCIKDTWTKPKAGKVEGGRRGWGWGKMETTILQEQLKKKWN